MLPETDENEMTTTPQDQEQFSFPCSVVQKTCWYFDKANPGHPSNNIAVRFQLDGALDAARLEAALLEIVKRHEVLRTRFLMHGGEPRQIVEAAARFDFRLRDLSELPDVEQGKRAEEISSEEAVAGFNLAVGPLFRGQLLRLTAERHMLLLTMHHIVADGWSVGIVTDELGEMYEALGSTRTAVLPSLEIQYADYAIWQAEYLAGEELARSVSALKGKLDGYAPVQFETDYPRPLNPTGAGEIRSRVLPRELTDKIKQIAEKEGCTFFMAMYAAFLALLHKETGQSDLVVKTPSAGRGRVELEPLVGWFVNPLVVRTRLDDQEGFLTLLRDARESILDAFAHQDTPFEKLMEEIRPKVLGKRQPPLPVNFILQRDFVKPWTKAGLRLTAIPSKSAGVFVDVNFFLVERESGWRASVDISRELFATETGEGWLRAFEDLLQAFAAEPDRAIASIALTGLRQRKTAAEDSEAATYVAARNDTERKIISIWQGLLGEERIGANDNFFDLGGHSILATKLVGELQASFGQTIQLRELFADPTPAGMARLVSAPDMSSTDQGFVEIQKGAGRQPFLLIDGDHWFRNFAQLTDPCRPFIGVPLRQFGSFAGETERHEVARKVAAKIIEEMPGQPYALGGWCDAGVTAFAVAEYLAAMGAKVSLLALFDAMQPDYWHSLQSMVASTSHTVSRLSSRFTAIPDKGLFSAIGSAAKDVSEGLGRGVRRLPKLFSASSGVSKLSYPVLLLRPAIHGVGDPTLGWRRICTSGLDVVEVPGDHASIFREPHVVELARLFGQELDKHLGKAQAIA
jgi:thioesterase domain-containing protein/acyl carrier protein